MFLVWQRKFTRFTFLFAVWCVAQSAAAQTSADPLSFVQRQEGPGSTAWNGRADEQYKVDITRVRIRVPVFLDGKRTILLPGASYERLGLDLRGAASIVGQDQPASSDLTLHAPLAEVGLVHRANEQWMVHGTFFGGLASDFAGSYTHDDLAFTGRLIALYRASEKLTVGLGAAYDTSTRNVSFIPVGILKWAPSSRWLISTLLPKVVLVSYRASSWLSSSLRTELELSRFHLDESRYGIEHLYFRYLGVLLGPTLTFSPDRFLHVDLFGGCALRWIGTYVYEGPLGADLYFNAPDPVRARALSPSAFFSLRFWVGLEGWSSARM